MAGAGLTTMMQCEIKASRVMWRALAAVHVMAAVSVWLTALPWQGQISLTALVLYSFWRLRQEDSDVHLRCQVDGVMELKRGEEWYEVETLSGGMVWPFLSVLRLRSESERVVIPMLSDSMEKEEFRRLRAWLRWKASNKGGK